MNNANNMLLYDEYCPMCVWYSGLFLKYGFIKAEERVSYQKAAIDYAEQNIDFNKAKNEIAYYNAARNETVYGVNSLLSVIFKNQPLIIRFFQLPIISTIVQFLYGLISYNRKIFAPSTACNSDICMPDKSWKYRIGLMLVTWIIVSLTVGPFFLLAYNGYLRWHFAYIDAIIFGSQFIWQGIVFRMLSKRSIYDYFGQLCYVSLIGALLLIGFYGVLKSMAHFGIDITPLGPTCFGITLGIMVMIHIKRVKDNGHNSWLTLSWIVFRTIAAFIVFKF